MNLYQLRAEVLAHGFDAGLYTARVNQYLNDALRSLARKIDFYADEASQAFTTTAGQGIYPWPSDLGKARYLRDTDLNVTLHVVRLRELDDSPPSSGRPQVYAINGPAFVLWPTPDATYNMALRYWSLPPLMVSDLDSPTIPQDYHNVLIYYALQRCYESEDDSQMAQYWQGQWQGGLRDMGVDVKFPSTDGPRRVKSMWGEDGAPRTGWGLP